MAEPKKRLTSTRTGNRRSHYKLKSKKLANCPRCKNLIISHRVCPLCGYYKNDNILQLDEKERLKQERRRQREEAEKEKYESQDKKGSKKEKKK